MVAWSSLMQNAGLRNSVMRANFWNPVKEFKRHNQCGSSAYHIDDKLSIRPSKWQWYKFKDMLHYYFIVGVAPCLAIVIYADVFVGPAKLAPIPEGYRPKHWEYYRHPIQRFIAKYAHNDPQQDYEKYLHFLYEQDELAKLKELDGKVRELIKERKDYHVYYYRPITANYLRVDHETHEEMEQLDGYN